MGYALDVTRFVPERDPTGDLGSKVRQCTDRERLKRYLRELGRRLRRPVWLYLVGGSVLIDLGLDAATGAERWRYQADPMLRGRRVVGCPSYLTGTPIRSLRLIPV